VGVVLADDPSELDQRVARVVPRTELPDDAARLSADDREDIRFARAPDQVVGMKA
jgi:hypothetical protein